MKTFIKISEVWVPNKEHTHLILKDGIYSDFTEFKAISEKKKFAYQEGLPGTVWETGHPIVVTDLEDAYFERTEEAQEVGLKCAIGMPVFSGEFLLAVIVFLCGDDEAHSGAIEVWANDPDRENELGVIDGYYGTLEYFEFISRKTKIMKGFGLPGQVWEKETPVLMEDLGNSTSFIRGRDAKNAGITTGIGIPLSIQQKGVNIMVFLSAKTTPIARRLQVWLPDKEHEKLSCLTSYGVDNDDSIRLYESKSIGKGEGLLGHAWLTGVPEIGHGHLSGSSSSPASVDSLLAVPVIDNGRLQAIVTFMF